MEKRTCNGCTACCKTHPVNGIDKPANEWCQHCKIGVGCGIYDTRPVECSRFECQWLKGWGSEVERPDKTGVVIDYFWVEALADKAVSLWGIEEGTLSGQYARQMTLTLLEKGFTVLHIHPSGTEQGNVVYFPTLFKLCQSNRDQLALAGIEVEIVPPLLN